MNNQELWQLAQDIHAGKVFADRHIPKEDESLVSSIFMVLNFLKADQWEAFERGVRSGDVGMLYEYLDQAGSRTINGYPSFFSYRTLSAADAERVFEMVGRLRGAIAAAAPT